MKIHNENLSMGRGTAATGSHRAGLLSFFAVISVAIYLVPEGGHFFEMFGKLRLAPDNYMIVQRIYHGWAFFGIAIVFALTCTLSHAVATWRRPITRWLSLASFAALLATQAIFWTFISPVNALTRNWTEMPADVEAVRRQWEYAHATSAALTLLALILIVYAVLLDVTNSPADDRG
ncbi:hypothetical protein ACVDG8_000165 [Mesorhizobium sp. ORM8.1]